MNYHTLPLALEQRFERTVDLAVSLYAANSHLNAEQIRQRPGSCAKITVIQWMLLRELGTDAMFMRSGNRTRPHIFLGYQDEFIERTYSDTTWQQFLEGDTHDKPATLLFSASRAQEQLGSMAVQPDIWSIWTDAHEGPIDLPTILAFSPQVARVFEKRRWPQHSLNGPTNVAYY